MKIKRSDIGGGLHKYIGRHMSLPEAHDGHRKSKMDHEAQKENLTSPDDEMGEGPDAEDGEMSDVMVKHHSSK